MARLSAKLRSIKGGIMWWCPACNSPHSVPIGDGRWSWDENAEAPTITPSVRIFDTIPEDEAGVALPLPAPRSPIQRTLCHSIITAGEIQFAGDSPHALSGKKVPMSDWPHADGAFGGA